MVQESIELMKEKKISKIVLSRQKNFDFDFNIFQQLNFISQANRKFTDCVNFLYDFKDLGIFFGISPETLFKTNDDKFYSEALAGTFKSTESLNNIDTSKEFEEHKFVSDHIKESISAFSNNPNIGMSQPSYNECKFTIDNNQNMLQKVTYIK